MMKLFSRGRRFSTRLVLGLFVLVLVTTLSAGVPAYWLTRTQLERQAWSHVEATQQATLSLFQAQQNRLVNQATLLAERPTLERLLREQALDELGPYLQAFQSQSRLDILLVCGADGSPLAAGPAVLDRCPGLALTEYRLLAGRPALLAAQPVYYDISGDYLGMAVTGSWLNAGFLRQMAADTGVQQSIVRPDGVRLASSLPGVTAAALGGSLNGPGLISQPGRYVLEAGGRRYYAAVSPLMGSDDQMVFLSEVALPVDALVATEINALAILVASTGLVAVLGMILGAWYIRRLTAPLQQLTQVAERIGAGELLAAIPSLSGPAEVTTLATALEHSQATMLQAMDERSQARDWLDNLIQSIVEGVVTFDTGGRITFMSQGAEMMLGWRSEEAVGLPVNTVLPLAEESGETFLERIPPHGQKHQIEVRTRSGKNVVLAVTGSRMVPPDSDTVQVALVLRDVTEEEARRHLRSYFLANISHEFRTPLSTLNASIELLMDEAEDLSAAEMRQLLKPTYLSLLGLQNLIDNLLESSSIEAGRFSLRRRPVDLNQIVTNAVQMVRPLLERRRQSLSLVEPGWLAGDGAPELQADAGRLTQALVNLLANASKYSPIGRSVDLCLEQREAMLRVSVADRGPGIPAAERANVFRRFVRLDAQDGEQYGVGLGLFVVRTTIEAHGGRVGVDERPGGGSVFWFELPLVTAGEMEA